jgi:regulator of CtrA degradation
MRDEMSRFSVVGVSPKSSVTVSFAEHYARSEQFDQIFRAGMELVEETAVYLDGPGRQEAKKLSPALAVLYATESMRLTSRLLELASWLIVRRSLKAGEITVEEAREKRRRIKLVSIGRPSHVDRWAELPQSLRDLVEASFGLNDRIIQLDRALERPVLVASGRSDVDPVGSQVALLAEAFGVSAAQRH